MGVFNELWILQQMENLKIICGHFRKFWGDKMGLNGHKLMVCNTWFLCNTKLIAKKYLNKNTFLSIPISAKGG